MSRRSARSLTVIMCLVASANPVTAQEQTGPLVRAVTREAVRLALEGEHASDIDVAQSNGTFAQRASRTGTTQAAQAQPGQTEGWFKRNTIWGCTFIGAGIGTVWAVSKSGSGSCTGAGCSTSGLATPFGFLFGAGVGAVVGLIVKAAR